MSVLYRVEKMDGILVVQMETVGVVETEYSMEIFAVEWKVYVTVYAMEVTPVVEMGVKRVAYWAEQLGL